MHDIQCACRPASFTTTAGIGYGQLYRGATIRQRRPRHAARASAHLPWLRLRLPSNSCWSSSRSGSRALGRRHTTKPSRTGHAEYASRRSLRSVGMVIVGAKACDAPRQQQRQRDRSSGRDDVSGCSRPCLIAYYDLAYYDMARLRSGPRPARWPRKKTRV